VGGPGASWPPPPDGTGDPEPGRPGPPGRRSGGSAGGWRGNPRAVLWTIGIVAVVAVLARAHKSTEDEIVLFCVIVPSIILHEIAHGWVALAFGDDTAKRAGRLTLNPVAHVDPIGTLIVPGLLALSGVGMFGWAKPVPVNPGRLRHPRNEGVVVSLAGPATNIALVAVAYICFRSFHGLDTITPEGTFGALWAEVAFYLGLVNLWLAAFNMIPVPPLDGSVLLERLLPRSWWPGYLRIRPYTMPILLVVVVLNFYLHPGPLTWLYDRLFDWWAGRLGL
jgi:Zn-dependent protease